jgi:hypothetical protein
MLMLINTADPRYRGGLDPDEERRRRWEGIERRSFVFAAGSCSCLIAGAVTAPLITLLLNAMAIVFCGLFVRTMLPARRARGADDDSDPA